MVQGIEGGGRLREFHKVDGLIFWNASGSHKLHPSHP